MEVIEALDKLSFSFWQVVILILAFNFRQEIKGLLDRISSITLMNTGIELSNGSEIVPELKALKLEIQKKNSSTQNVVDLIDTKIRNRLCVSLTNIKTNTTYLWRELLVAQLGSSLSAAIRHKTVDKISFDLSLLRGAGIFEYELTPHNNLANVFQLTVNQISEDICALVAEVESQY